MKKVTMKEVARKAGVSIATVSNVINDVTGKTTPVTRERVYKVIKELDYKIDMTARTLSCGKSNLVGIFYPKVSMNGRKIPIIKDNPFYVEILCGIENALSENGYHILISGVDNPEDAAELIEKRMLDAVAGIGIRDEEVWKAIASTNVPIVSVDSETKYATANIIMDNEYGAYIATKHLIENGHKRIAMCTIQGFVDYLNESAERPKNKGRIMGQRYNGFERAIKEAGLDIEECPIIGGEFTIEGGERIANLLNTRYKDITAIFCAADIMALGIIKGYTEMGKNIPEDLSVVGFDNIFACDYFAPGLTTIKQDIFGKGVKTAEVLMGYIKEKDDEGNRKCYILPVELVERGSVKKL